jgi:RNA polymerase sigma factor (sigma-70 family)
MERGVETQEERDAFFREVTAGMAATSESAYRRFYEACFDKLYRPLLVQTRGREDLAQELAQTVLLRVVRYIEPFESERALWAWLRRLARSCHVDWLRRRDAEPAAESLELFEGNIAAEEADSSDEELLNHLDCAMKGLEAPEKRMIHLAYFERVPQRGIAEKLQTTEKAVESKLARIRRKLRGLLIERLKDYALL